MCLADLSNDTMEHSDEKVFEQKPELKDEKREPEKSEVSIQDMRKTPQKYRKGAQNDQLTERRREEPEKLKELLPVIFIRLSFQGGK